MSTTDHEMVLAHFIVSDDVERSRRFYTEVLGGRAVLSGEGDDGVTYVALANSWAAFRRFRDDVALSPRPLRLLTKPEPIEAIATVPDGPPVRFRWRRALHEVVAADGPERIEGAWWSEEGGPARDYFRVEDKAGLRFWLFRAGLYRSTAQPQWFLHGTFA